VPDPPTERALLQAADGRLPAFTAAVEGVPFESRGVLFSEMLFLAAALHEAEPRRILESGRARGQSTLLFARLFPHAEILSVDLERDTADSRFAEARLAALPNVRLLYGDSRELLPRLVRPGDFVFVDGPKGFRALRLALRLLRGEPGIRALALHACALGPPEREFLDRHVAGVLCSDCPAFVERFRHLDEPCWARIRELGSPEWQPHCFGGHAQRSYGPTVAFLDAAAIARPGRLLRRAWLEGTLHRWLTSLRKRASARRPASARSA
jgi:hypothetical protein